MKRLNITRFAGTFFAAAAITVSLLSGCTKFRPVDELPVENEPFAELLKYKNSPHELSMGYYRTWHDRTVSGNVNDPIMTELPDSLDIVSVFANYTPGESPYWDSLKLVYIPYLHARGTKVINTGGYFHGAASDSAGLAKWTQGIVNMMNEYNYDGYDIDIERTSAGGELADQIACFKALSKHLGPLSGTAKLLIYDTNQDGNALSTGIKDMVSYVFLQTYGRGTGRMQSTFDTYTSHIGAGKLLISFSFYEERGYPGNVWYDVTYPQNGTGRAYDLARWEPSSGKKGGVFSYAIDRDAPLTSAIDNTIRKPDFRVTRDLIQIMNPAKTNP
nr:glycosyl hydrolase family 18 protein [uncultured Chitinophaga sp.]